MSIFFHFSSRFVIGDSKYKSKCKHRQLTEILVELNTVFEFIANSNVREALTFIAFQ